MTRFSRNAQIKRQWRILLALKDRHWWTIDEIADAAGISDRHHRTVHRDLDALMEVFPIQRRPEHREPGVPFEYRLRKPILR